MTQTTSHDYQTDEHIHELCTETHIGKGEWAKKHMWTAPHCTECGLVICPEHLVTVGFGSCKGNGRRLGQDHWVDMR